VILSPIILLIALGIKISSPGPVHYSQVRIGHKGRTFLCHKFRTMHLRSDTTIHENYLTYLIHHEVAMQKLDQDRDDRIFPFGRLLRRSSLDELPQLLNILKGDMSLVGPRPGTPNEYQEYLQWHRHRVDVLPGLSGLWQVSGKNRTTFNEMMRLDIRYIQYQSLLMDTIILLKTFPAVIDIFRESSHSNLHMAGSQCASIAMEKQNQHQVRYEYSNHPGTRTDSTADT
jgi:lipopolysaccharide/colanic/teichoic acid biosynthesis glycosyltransferase